MNEWNVRRWKKLRIEGFQLSRFLNLCSANAIGFRDLKVIDDCTMEGSIDARDLPQLQKLTGNRYRVTVLGQYGLESKLRIMLSRTATCVGLLCFCGIIYIQSLFISQIQISGYERITEQEIRETLGELGFYPGALKSYDLEDLKTQMFHELDQITWVGITYEGTMAKVEILEGTVLSPLEDTTYPVHIVSDLEGYVESIMVKEGVAQKQKGEYVKSGDILISGEVPITDRSYQREEDQLIRYVHAQGEAKLRVLHRVTCYQPRMTTILEESGRWIPGLSIRIGTWSWDSDRVLRPWQSSRRDEVAGWEGIRPIPWKISIYRNEEICVMITERSEQEVLARAEQQIRAISKEILPKDAQLIKKDLSFSQKENIIEVNVMLHSLETVGVDQIIPQ